MRTNRSTLSLLIQQESLIDYRLGYCARWAPVRQSAVLTGAGLLIRSFRSVARARHRFRYKRCYGRGGAHRTALRTAIPLRRYMLLGRADRCRIRSHSGCRRSRGQSTNWIPLGISGQTFRRHPRTARVSGTPGAVYRTVSRGLLPRAVACRSSLGRDVRSQRGWRRRPTRVAVVNRHDGGAETGRMRIRLGQLHSSAQEWKSGSQRAACAVASDRSASLATCARSDSKTNARPEMYVFFRQDAVVDDWNDCGRSRRRCRATTPARTPCECARSRARSVARRRRRHAGRSIAPHARRRGR